MRRISKALESISVRRVRNRLGDFLPFGWAFSPKADVLARLGAAPDYGMIPKSGNPFFSADSTKINSTSGEAASAAQQGPPTVTAI